MINAFADKNPLKKDTYYIFFLHDGESGKKEGYMPRKKQAGFIFTDRVSSSNMAKAIAHELAHGAFRLKHTFQTYPSLTESSTDNLMDYNTGTKLHKYQWDLIHDPVAMLGLFDGDKDGALKSLFSSKYVFMHDQLSTTAYTSKKGKDEFSQEVNDIVDSKLYQLDTAKLPTYIYFGYIWFHQGNINRFDKLVDNTFAHARDSIETVLGKSKFNLLVIVNAKYDTALAGGVKTVSFREKFMPVSGLRTDCTEKVNEYISSASRKKFVDGLDDALKERAEKLLEHLKGCEIVIPPEIVIHYKRKGRNQHRTWGEFTILGTDYKGYILERPKGSDPTKLQDYKRHPAGTYEINYSEKSGVSSKFKHVTLNLVAHPAYILHCGNRADQSDGCLLINYNSPQFDKYADAFQSYEKDVNKPAEQRSNNPSRLRPVSNDYPDKYPDKNGSAHANPNNPAYKLRQKIKELEDEIKAFCKCESIVKKLIIDESEEKEEL